jgi:hypothetical protein
MPLHRINGHPFYTSKVARGVGVPGWFLRQDDIGLGIPLFDGEVFTEGDREPTDAEVIAVLTQAGAMPGPIPVPSGPTPGYEGSDAMAYHYHLVFPFSPPPVQGRWDDVAWTTYIRGNRPADYTGGETDKEAWAAYCDEKNRQRFQAFWGDTHEVSLVGPDQFRITAKE